MDRRTFLLGLLGGIALAPAVIVAASSAEATSGPEPSPLLLSLDQPQPEQEPIWTPSQSIGATMEGATGVRNGGREAVKGSMPFAPGFTPGLWH